MSSLLLKGKFFFLFLPSDLTVKIFEHNYAVTAVALGAEFVMQMRPQKAVGHISFPVNRRLAGTFDRS